MIIEEKAKATLTLPDETILEIGEIDITTLSLSSKAVSGSSFELGSVCSEQLSMQFMLDGINPYSIIGGVVKLFLYKNGEWFQKGLYNVTSCKRYKRVYNLQASDNMILLDFSAFQVGGSNEKINLIAEYFRTEKSIYDILSYIISLTGLELGNTEEEINAMPNGQITSEMYTQKNYNGNVRDWIAWCAEILGGFATADEYGRIKINQFEMNSSAVISNAMINSGSSDIADFTVAAFDVSITFYNGSWYKTYTVTNEKELMLSIAFDDNPIAQGYYYICTQRYSGDTFDKKIWDFTGAVWEAVGNLPIRPMSISVASNELYHIGQRVTVQNSDGNYVDSLITSFNWSLHDLQKIKCVGEDTRLISKIRQRSELARATEEAKTLINEAYGRDVTQAELDALEADNKLIEGQVFYIYE